METMEMPMSQGVAQTIDTQELEVGNLELEQESENSNEKLSGSMHDSQTIDSLLEQAAEEGTGFEEILTKIADGEFEEEMEEQEVIEVPEEETEEPEEELDVEGVVMSSEEFLVLEEKLDILIETTQAMSEKLDKIPQDMRLGAKEFIAMILAMYKLAKDEKSKKKRGSLFLFLIKLIGTFMQSIADPEALEKLEPKEHEEQEDEEPDEGNLIKMMEYLEKNGMLAAA